MLVEITLTAHPIIFAFSQSAFKYWPLQSFIILWFCPAFSFKKCSLAHKLHHYDLRLVPDDIAVFWVLLHITNYFLYRKWERKQLTSTPRTGHFEDGHDVAVIELPQPVFHPKGFPVVAAPGFSIYLNFRVFGFKWGPSLQVAGFDVIKNELCPQMKEVGNNTICANSTWASMNAGGLKIELRNRSLKHVR